MDPSRVATEPLPFACELAGFDSLVGNSVGRPSTARCRCGCVFMTSDGDRLRPWTRRGSSSG